MIYGGKKGEGLANIDIKSDKIKSGEILNLNLAGSGNFSTIIGH